MPKGNGINGHTYILGTTYQHGLSLLPEFSNQGLAIYWFFVPIDQQCYRRS